MSVCQVKSGFVLEADIKTISRQIISIVTQVKRDRESKQQQSEASSGAVKDAAGTAATAVPPAGASAQPASQSVPVGGSVTSSSTTSLPTPGTAVATTPQSRIQQQPAAAPAAATATATSPTATGWTTDLYINKLDAGLAILFSTDSLATLSIAKGDPFKLTSPAQHALCR